MFKHVLLLAILLLLVPVSRTLAQADSNDHYAHPPAVFQPLNLPTANLYRDASGKPGPDYWQQQANYKIKATLEPSEHRITGSETIHYTNNSPNNLNHLWLQLDQNLFATDSRGDFLQPPQSRWRGSFDSGGFKLESVQVVHNEDTSNAAYTINDTRMRIDLSHPLEAKGGAIDLQINYTFVVPQYGADRMGRLDAEQGTVYEIAQWYPRMYVYDDVRGWNPLPYLGQGEFYLEYGSFDVELTVPHDLIVVATGTLENPEEVLTERQQKDLARARSSKETVTVIGADEVGKKDTRPSGNGPLTWKFHADNVRDFSWAASRSFIWDAAAADDVLIMSVYPKEGLGSKEHPGWENSTQYARHTIHFYSDKLYKYPYPVAINVGGVVGGMEYPMIVFCGIHARDQGLYGVTDHEFGHSWFPMVVGSDERRYAWMDEGFNTFINYYSNIDFYGNNAGRSARLSAGYIVKRMESPIADQPIMTYPDRLRPEGLGFLAYRKPGKGLVLLREYILGPKRFDKAFRTYIRRWAYKHPQPADFFRTIEDVSGEDLDWFWREWIYDTDLLDQSIDNVAMTGKENRAVVTLANRKEMVMPVVLEVTYTDGATNRIRIPVEVWDTSNRYQATLKNADHIASIGIDPDQILPDIDRDNNTWKRDENPGVAGPKGK